MTYIGIDLGTTYSCVAIVENGRPKAIHNDDGKNIIPSVVAFGEKETLVGNSALDYNTDLSNILYDSKRLIGWHILYDLPNADDRQLWTFDVDMRNNSAGYVLNKGKSNEKFILPEEVSAEILKSLKDQAERYTNQKVTKAVVTVPASFNSDQIAATKRAIEMAGLKLKDLLKEPTASMLAYIDKFKLERSKIMVFDFGGGTLDICIAQINPDDPDGYKLKATTGDLHLGGQDFDSRIMKYVIDEFRKTSDYDIYERPKLVKRLRTECRKAKEFLSTSKNPVNIHLDINDDVAINILLSIEKLNELCSDLFDKAMVYVDRALNTARISSNQLNYVILVGGSTRIPEIRQRLENKFGKSKLKFDINPDEAVAFGAAIAANSPEDGIMTKFINLLWRQIKYKPLDENQILFYLPYRDESGYEGRICVFNLQNYSVEKIGKFRTFYWPYEVATTQDNIFGINTKSFELYNLDTRMVLIDKEWQTGSTPSLPTHFVQKIRCDGILYVIDGYRIRKIYRLSDDKREWIEIGEIPERRIHFGVASLNGKIYITGGENHFNSMKSCLCFDPSASADSRIPRIADMNYARCYHSLIVANGKLYAIGGFQKAEKGSDGLYWPINFCDAIEEYDPQTNKWQEVGTLKLK